ncbi:MAG TPA: phosphotransferase [Coxiellaceae bacterium]|nr:phosphotransferase [Coxiellaceae bacterium]
MENYNHILKWATEYLISKRYFLQRSPEIIVETPWSKVILFPTLKEDVYLKQTPPSLFLESKILKLLSDQFHVSVPIIIADNDELHCFLMKDAGQSLRKYLKNEFQLNLLQKAIMQYTAIQRAVENHIEAFLMLGVPDWRLSKLPHLYKQLINQAELLKAEGLTNKELKLLRHLSAKLSEQCESLSQYQIPETLVQPDFHTNNILIDPNTNKITFIDMGEIVITHPFFSLYNFLLQATIHHNLKESDPLYHQIQSACCKNWLEFATKNQLLDAFAAVKNLWPIYSALALYRLMTSVDLQAFKAYSAGKPNRLAGYFREYIASNG